jgi:hypothetical protein
MCHESNRLLVVRCKSALIGVPGAVILAFVGATGPMLAQDANAPPVSPRPGFEVRSISVNAVYYSKGLPDTGGSFQANTNTTKLPSDLGMGGSIVFDWTRFTERSTFSLNYTPSYTGRVRYSSLDALNHAFSLNTTRKLAPRWRWGVSAGGNYSSVEQSLFAANSLSNVASVQSNFSDLAAGMLASKFANNPQLGVVLTNSPLPDSPVQNLLYGQRMFKASANTSLSYSFSPRLSVTFGGGGSRSQHVSDNQPSAATRSFELPNTTSGSANIGISYSLSPTTQLSGAVNTNRIASTLQDAYTTNATATLGRTLSRRWLAQIHGGLGITNLVRQGPPLQPSKPRPVIGGNLVYKTFSQTFLGSFDRTVSDAYGLGATTSATASAAWRWRHPGNSWWIESGFSWQLINDGALGGISGWRTSTGLNRAIGSYIVLLTQYAYMNYSQSLRTSESRFSQHAVRVAMIWTPQPNTMR